MCKTAGLRRLGKNKNENKRTKISRSADKVQWDKKKNKSTLISACGCKGWLWLWLWLSFAVPVFSKDALLRGGGQLRDMFDMFYQPGPPRAPLGLWDWKAPWADNVFEQQRRQRQSTAAQRSLNSTVVTQEAWYASFDVEWPLGDEPLLNLGWMVFMGIFGGCWSCLFNLSIGDPFFSAIFFHFFGQFFSSFIGGTASKQASKKSKQAKQVS